MDWPIIPYFKILKCFPREMAQTAPNPSYWLLPLPVSSASQTALPAAAREFVNPFPAEDHPSAALRERMEELPPSQVFTNSNVELARRIIGFIWHGTARRHMTGQYTQFKGSRTGSRLPTLYISAHQERKGPSPAWLGKVRETRHRSDINCTGWNTCDLIGQVFGNNGTGKASCKQFGISRTTLRRYMNLKITGQKAVGRP